MELFLIF